MIANHGYKKSLTIEHKNLNNCLQINAFHEIYQNSAVLSAVEFGIIKAREYLSDDFDYCQIFKKNKPKNQIKNQNQKNQIRILIKLRYSLMQQLYKLPY